MSTARIDGPVSPDPIDELTHRVRSARDAIASWFAARDRVDKATAHTFILTQVDRIGGVPLALAEPGRLVYDPWTRCVVGTWYGASSDPLVLHIHSVVMPLDRPADLPYIGQAVG